MTTPTNPDALQRVTYFRAQVDKLAKLVTNPWTPDVLSSTESFKSQIVAALSQSPKNGSLLALAGNGFITYASGNSWRATDKEYKDVIKKLIGSAIPIYDANVVDAIMRGCATGFNNYSSHFSIWNNDKTNKGLMEAIRISYTHFESDLATYYICQVQKPGFEVDELDEFAVIANFHLTVLRDCAIYGTQWGFKQNTVDLYKNKLRSLIVDYERYACQTFDKGMDILEKIIKDSPSKYFHLDWNKLNQYKRQMTISVFDYVANWWLFDIDLFPNGVTSERVRYIFSDIIGYPMSSDGTQLNRPLKEIIKTINLYKRYQGELQKIDYNRSVNGTRIINIRPSYWSWESNSNRLGTLFGGQVLNGSTELKTMIVNNCDETVKNTKFTSESDLLPRRITFENGSYIEPSVMRAAKPDPSATDVESQVIGIDGITKYKNVGYDGHKISHVVGIGVNKYSSMLNFTEKEVLDAMVIGYSLNECYTENVLMKDSITIVDAQKYATEETVSPFQKIFMSVNQVMFSVHAMHFYQDTKVSYYFNLESDQMKSFYLAIYVESYYGDSDTTMDVISPKNFDKQLGTFTLKKGDRHVIIPMDKNVKLTFSNMTNAGVQLVHGLGECHIASLIFIPGNQTPLPRTQVKRGASPRDDYRQQNQTDDIKFPIK